jgi:hypothetical protein
MAFYPDQKDGMSPSALAQWFNSRSAFVKSYFEGDRSPTTKAMEAGTQIHALVEAGIIKAKHIYDVGEEEISITIAEGRVFRGRPDSHQKKAVKGTVSFVDYKSGKANAWKEKLPTDIKMKATAWLVWMQAGQPEKVEGYVEFIQTTWDPESRTVVPIDDKETEVEHVTYWAEDLKAFTGVILKAMSDVEDFYQKWQTRGDFVNSQDVAMYAETKAEIVRLEAELESIGERIASQMEFGGQENHKTNLGTFYFTTRETYDYPADLPVRALDQELTLGQADEVAAATKAAKKNFELIAEPVSTKTTMAYKAPKER